MNFEFVTIICFSKAFSEICSMNDESEVSQPLWGGTGGWEPGRIGGGRGTGGGRGKGGKREF